MLTKLLNLIAIATIVTNIGIAAELCAVQSALKTTSYSLTVTLGHEATDLRLTQLASLQEATRAMGKR